MRAGDYMRIRLYVDGELADEAKVLYSESPDAAEGVAARQQAIVDANGDKPFLLEFYDSESGRSFTWGDDVARMDDPRPLPIDMVARNDQLAAIAKELFS
jgi:hypothetical protein